MNGFNGFESTSRNRGKAVQIPSFFEEVISKWMFAARPIFHVMTPTEKAS